ncbi:MAG: hypothetical protein ACOX50_01645 [Patescibacteria group bacterium]|jgi:hypothetical protein
MEGIKSGIKIYGRYGLYEITTKKAIKQLLKYLAEDQVFLEEFVDEESIFDASKEKGDQKLIEHIGKFISDGTTISLLKKIIFNAFEDKNGYLT